MAEIMNTTGNTGVAIVSPELKTGVRRKLQLFRNAEFATGATAAETTLKSLQNLEDGEIVIARYGANDGVLGIKTNTDEGEGMVLFDSAALSSALQSVQGGLGVSVYNEDANNPIINLDIDNAELVNGTIEVKDNNGEKIFEITGVTAANVTYANDGDKVIENAETTSAAIKELDAALDAANKANLSGATVTAADNVATVQLEDSAKNKLASFKVESSDDNLEVAKATGEGITLDIKSVGATATGGTGTISGDTDATDALTQKSYVDNEIAKAIKNGTVKVETGKAETTATGTAVFQPEGNTNDYYVHLTAGDNVYDIKLDADAFVKDSFLDSVEIVDGPIPDTTATKKAKYFKFVWKTDKGAEGEETETTYIETSKILGDLVGGDGIKFDGSNIAIDLADQPENSLVKLSLDGTTDGERQLNVNVTTGETTFNKDAEGDAKKWSVAEGKDGLTTATEVVKVANNLQDQIDTINGKQTSGSTAITVTTGATGDVIALKLDNVTAEGATIEEKPVGQYVGEESNALAITSDGLYLSNVWDCGTF